MVAPIPIEWSTTWRFRAACRGEDSSLFFAPSYFERREEKDGRERRAREICNRCDVRSECLEYALRTRESHGVWGGMNEQERRALLRERDLRERELRAG
jgi:WhiB family transcriptional regulator, redox-sensing transcriptional regulator